MNSLKYWQPESFEISSYKFQLKDRINKTYKTSGSDNTNLCTYSYNELGFRGESITKSGFKIMSLGCSITEGVGVNDHETWPRQFSKLIENGVDLNFGTGGRSNDFICRCLFTFFEVIKPDLVLVMYTFPQRREIYTIDNQIEPYISKFNWGYLKETEAGNSIQKNMDELQNDELDFINWYKNHLLIKLFLENKKCNWLWNGKFTKFNYNEFNRFDGFDSETFIDKSVDNMHPGPLHHKHYSKLLYDYLCANFPNYMKKIV